MLNVMEQQLSEYLDDLLVAANVEIPRHRKNGSIAPVRIHVKFTIPKTPNTTPHFTVKYKGAECSFSLVDGCPLLDKISPKMQGIVFCVAQMWIEKRDDIIKVCKEAMGVKYLNVNTDDDDDSLVCDGLHVTPDHVFRRRKRPWLENTK